MSDENLLTYKYSAVDASGKKVEGEITARTKQEVLELLHERNFWPMNIEEKVRTAKEIGNIDIIPKKVKTKDLTVFCRQLSTMLRAGLPIDKAMRLMIRMTEHKTLKQTLKQVSTKISQGMPLSTAMKEHEVVFPKILINMTEAGELTGGLDVAMDRMAAHFEKQNKIDNKVKGAMIYPIVLLCITVVVFMILMIYIIPIFAEMYASSNTKLPALTAFMMKFSDLIAARWYLFLLVIVGIVFGIRSFLAWDKGRYWFDMRKLQMPVIKKPMRQLVTARFTRTLSTLLSCGIQLVGALNSSAETVGNVVIEEAVAIATEEVKTGASLSSQLEKIEYFPFMMTSMMSIGEESGELDEMLEKTASFYDEEAEAAIQKLISLIEPLAIVFMGIVVGVVVVAMYMPLLGSYSTML